MHDSTKLNRRQLAKLGGGLGLWAMSPKVAVSKTSSNEPPRYLITLTCSGGASIIDSFLALTRDDVAKAGGDPDTLNCFPMKNINRLDGLPFTAVNLDTQIPNLGKYPVKTDQLQYLKEFGQDMTVITSEGSSVNHNVAQHRSVTGNNAWNGRTLMEAVAAEYGASMTIPYIDLASDGYAERGIDPGLPKFARATQISDPLTFPLGLSSHENIPGIPAQHLDLARSAREDLEEESTVGKRQNGHPIVQRWKEWRSITRESYENNELLKAFDIRNPLHPDREKLFNAFPKIGIDPLESQAAIAAQALLRGISNTVSLGPSFKSTIVSLKEIYNPPIAFDFSHQDHRAVQGFMWDRVLSVASRLVKLLKEKEIGETGESMWSRTMIYFATDFGRDKVRPRGAEKFGTGHHLNNGSVILSPMFKGGRVLGGVNPKTALTYGFDLKTGVPDPRKKTSERELFAFLLHVMGIRPKGLPTIDFV